MLASWNCILVRCQVPFFLLFFGRIPIFSYFFAFCSAHSYFLLFFGENLFFFIILKPWQVQILCSETPADERQDATLVICTNQTRNVPLEMCKTKPSKLLALNALRENVRSNDVMVWFVLQEWRQHFRVTFLRVVSSIHDQRPTFS